MTLLARFMLLFASFTLGLLARATPTTLALPRDNVLTPRFVQPSGSPDVCFNNHHCLTVQTIDGGFFGLTLHGCSYSQVVDHTGYSWRSYVFGSPCSGLVELSCVANTTTGLVARGLVQFGFATEAPIKGINPSYLTSESPIVLGKAFGGSELLDPTLSLGKKRLDESRRPFVQWVVWCKAWGR